MSLFQDICKKEFGFDAANTVFSMDTKGNVKRWSNGQLLNTRFSILDWGDFILEYNRTKSQLRFSGIVYTEYNQIFNYVKDGQYHREDGPAVFGSFHNSTVGFFMKWYCQDKLHNHHGPSSYKMSKETHVSDYHPNISISDYHINNNHLYSNHFADDYLIIHLKEYVAPTDVDMLRLFQSEMAIIEKMKYNNDGKP